MKTTWDWSLESEANRIMHEAHQVQSGFFRLHHFYPLPLSPESRYIPQGVYFPRINYSQIPHFWERIRGFNTQSLITDPKLKDLQLQIIQQLEPLQLKPPDHSKVQQAWEKVAPRFFRLLSTFVPFAPQINQLQIHLSYFGTFGSFSLAQGDPTDLTVQLRLDKDVDLLAECILTGLTRPYLYTKRKASWEQSEFLVDYLLQHSQMAHLFPSPHVGTTEALNAGVSSQVISATEQFLADIGAPGFGNQSFTEKNGKIVFDASPLTNLTSREEMALAALIKCSPYPLTTDQLADLLFPNPEKFSLAAMTKFIERLRAKLEDAGISRHYLATSSGVGYYLKN